MDKAAVDRWLESYIEAWKTYDREQIGALFSDDVEYRYYPYNEPVRGRDAVVDSWLGEGDHPGASERDAPGTYDALYRCVAVDGDVAVATGSSTYLGAPGGNVDRIYENVLVMRFDEAGRCREYTEWYMKRPNP